MKRNCSHFGLMLLLFTVGLIQPATALDSPVLDRQWPMNAGDCSLRVDLKKVDRITEHQALLAEFTNGGTFMLDTEEGTLKLSCTYMIDAKGRPAIVLDETIAASFLWGIRKAHSLGTSHMLTV